MQIDSVDLGLGLRSCTPYKLPGLIDSAGTQGTQATLLSSKV